MVMCESACAFAACSTLLMLKSYLVCIMHVYMMWWTMRKLVHYYDTTARSQQLSLPTEYIFINSVWIGSDVKMTRACALGASKLHCYHIGPKILMFRVFDSMNILLNVISFCSPVARFLFGANGNSCMMPMLSPVDVGVFSLSNGLSYHITNRWNITETRWNLINAETQKWSVCHMSDSGHYRFFSLLVISWFPNWFSN